MKQFIILALTALSLAAAPNFSGNWKLAPAKSEFGNFPAPNSMTQKVTHEEPSVKISVSVSGQNGDFDYDSNYSTDGKETTNQFGPNDMKSTAKWEGESLAINTKGSFGDNEVTITDKWALSADGKTLTINRKFSSVQGDLNQKLVLEKQ